MATHLSTAQESLEENELHQQQQEQQLEVEQQEPLFSNEASREEFSMETRFVVLNFLGHVSSEPTLNSSQTSSLWSTRSQQSSSDESNDPEAEGDRLSSHNLQNLPNVCMLDKYRQSHAELQSATPEWTAMDEEVLDITTRVQARANHEEVLKEIKARRLSTPEEVTSRLPIPLINDFSQDISMSDNVLRDITSSLPDANDRWEELLRDITSRRQHHHPILEEVLTADTSRRRSHHQNPEEILAEIRRRSSNEERPPRDTVTSRRLPEPHAIRPTSIRLTCTTGRREPDQESDEGSDCGSAAARSIYSVASNATSVLDMQSDEVDRLVHVNALPSFVLPLREEIDWQMQQLRKGSASVPAGRMGALTPESEVAYYLSLIGDQVQGEYAGILGQLSQNVLSLPRERVTYSVYRLLVNELILSSCGWTRVALLLLLAQRIIYSLLSRGDRGIGGLAEYTVHLIEESSADFVVSSGGWNAVRDVDSPTSTVSWPQHQVTPDNEVRSQVARPATHLEVIQETDDPMSCSDSAISVNTPLSSQGALRLRDVSSESISSCILNEDGSDTPDACPHRPVIRTPVYSPLSENVRREIRLLRTQSDEISLHYDEERRWRHIGMAMAFTAIAAALVVYSKVKR